MDTIKFNIKISKWANFYFFIQNLSEWHFSNRKDYNLFWRKQLGAFSIQEEDALKKFKKIRLKYSQSKSCFEKAFFLSEDHFKELSKTLSVKECQIVKNTFFLLEDKFTFLYEKDLPLLNRWQEALVKVANNRKLTDTILVSLNTLYKTSIQKKEIYIYLLFSTKEHTGGSANIDNQSISIEISQYSLENINHALGIIWHEIIHMVFQNQYFYPLLVNYFSGKQSRIDFLNEAVTASLFPKGMLGIRLLRNKPANRLLSDINTKKTIEILNLTKKYLDQNKHFNKDYIKRLSLIIKKHDSYGFV